MTAIATKETAGSWAMTCADCPDFNGQAFDQRGAVRGLQAHDRAEHPLTGKPRA